ncbi:hypothetical protein [Paraburkholderia youngii]|uniref:hypothetical protein n=1 Tax=Paraburkholderia youngii TaxID=2782701 RepID=UPI003D1EAC68
MIIAIDGELAIDERTEARIDCEPVLNGLSLQLRALLRTRMVCAPRLEKVESLSVRKDARERRRLAQVCCVLIWISHQREHGVESLIDCSLPFSEPGLRVLIHGHPAHQIFSRDGEQRRVSAQPVRDESVQRQTTPVLVQQQMRWELASDGARRNGLIHLFDRHWAVRSVNDAPQSSRHDDPTPELAVSVG